MRALVLLVVVGCRSEAPAPAPAGSGSARTLTLDRPAVRVAGPQTWTHAVTVVALAYCPGDRELVTLDDTGRLRRFAVANGEQLGSFAVGRIATSLACGANDVVTANDIQIDRWGTLTPAPAAPREQAVRDVVVTMRGTALSIVRTRDDFRRDIPDACDDAFPTTPLALSHDGAHVALACRRPAGIRIYELASGVQASDDLPSHAAAQLAWSPDRTLLAVRAHDGLATWDGAKLATKPASAGHTLWWHSATELAIDTARGVLAWSPPDGPIRSLDPTPGIRAALPAGRVMIVHGEGDRPTALVDGAAREIQPAADWRPTDRVVVAPSGHRAIVLGTTLLDVDLRRGIAMAIARDVTAAAVDDRTLVYARAGKLVRHPDAVVGTHDHAITALALEGNLVAAGSTDGTISLFRDGALLGRLTGHDGAVTALAFSGDHRLASTGTDTTLVWDLRP